MPIYFFDSSAIVKNYVSEVGTNWINNVFNTVPLPIIYSVSVTEVEVVAAFARRAKGGTLSAADSIIAINQFRTDFLNDFRATEVTAKLLIEAVNLAQKYALRGYDAIQLAAATSVYDELILLGIDLSLNPFVFVSADSELNAAATTEGLTVDNPNNHP
jgi:uncharacterized protein